MRVLIMLILTLCCIATAHAANFVLKSKGFVNNGKIPSIYTCDNGNLSPQLSWENAPANTQSFVLVITTTDWSDQDIYFWTLYNIPSNVKSLPQGANDDLPDGVLVGMNFYNESNYHGPCPPDNRVHHYVFTIYALDSKLALPDGADPVEVLGKIKSHIINQAQLIGDYSH